MESEDSPRIVRRIPVSRAVVPVRGSPDRRSEMAAIRREMYGPTGGLVPRQVSRPSQGWEYGPANPSIGRSKTNHLTRTSLRDDWRSPHGK